MADIRRVDADARGTGCWWSTARRAEGAQVVPIVADRPDAQQIGIVVQDFVQKPGVDQAGSVLIVGAKLVGVGQVGIQVSLPDVDGRDARQDSVEVRRGDRSAGNGRGTVRFPADDLAVRMIADDDLIRDCGQFEQIVAGVV